MIPTEILELTFKRTVINSLKAHATMNSKSVALIEIRETILEILSLPSPSAITLYPCIRIEPSRRHLEISTTIR